MRPAHLHRESGQAAVEAAITLPLTLFLVLGALQLFLMLQARIFAEYAAFAAVRSGTVHHGNCEPMLHAAVAALLPTLTRTDSPAALAEAFRLRQNNRFQPAFDSGHTGSIVWLLREQPLANSIRADEEDVFDDPDVRGSYDTLQRLEARLVYWYPLRIPFANWVMVRMFMAHLGLRDFVGENPTLPVQTNAVWQQQGGATLDGFLGQEVIRRYDRQEYAWPLVASWTMRMMTPARRQFFASQHCAIPGAVP